MMPSSALLYIKKERKSDNIKKEERKEGKKEEKEP